MSDFEQIAKHVAEKGGCRDWPCDYACLRRGTCDHYERKSKELKTKEVGS